MLRYANRSMPIRVMPRPVWPARSPCVLQPVTAKTCPCARWGVCTQGGHPAVQSTNDKQLTLCRMRCLAASYTHTTPGQRVPAIRAAHMKSASKLPLCALGQPQLHHPALQGTATHLSPGCRTDPHLGLQPVPSLLPLLLLAACCIPAKWVCAGVQPSAVGSCEQRHRAAPGCHRQLPAQPP